MKTVVRLIIRIINSLFKIKFVNFNRYIYIYNLLEEIKN